MKSVTRGRLIFNENNTLCIRNQHGTFYHTLSSPSSARVGDLVELSSNKLSIFTPTRSVNPSQGMEKILDLRRLKAMTVRSKLEAGIREFFISQGFLETRTPLLVPCPGMEPHIRPFEVKSTLASASKTYLPTSPEFAMKRLLVGGLEKIFQICPAFRDEPESTTHLPEFTLLEWYRSYSSYDQIMEDTEKLFEFLALLLFGEPVISFQGRPISVKTPWPRLKVRDLFQNEVGVDLVQSCSSEKLALECNRLGIAAHKNEKWDDLYFKIWLNLIEPKLPLQEAVFVTRYPASQAALSVIDSDPDQSLWAKRFEIYAGGLELGNAFEELTDPEEQQKRFVQDMNLREVIYGSSFPKNPLDEEFLEALRQGMPPSGGIAVGIDRMVMLYADEADIHFTRWL